MRPHLAAYAFLVLEVLLLSVSCVGRPLKSDCKQVFRFDFDEGRDSSSSGIWQGREGRVRFCDGWALFDRGGSLYYPFFSYNDLRGGFAFSFKIKPPESVSGDVAILSNGSEKGTSTLTVFYNETSLGVRIMEVGLAGGGGSRMVELVVRHFKKHKVRKKPRQQLSKWVRAKAKDKASIVIASFPGNHTVLRLGRDLLARNNNKYNKSSSDINKSDWSQDERNDKDNLGNGMVSSETGSDPDNNYVAGIGDNSGNDESGKKAVKSVADDHPSEEVVEIRKLYRIDPFVLNSYKKKANKVSEKTTVGTTTSAYGSTRDDSVLNKDMKDEDDESDNTSDKIKEDNASKGIKVEEVRHDDEDEIEVRLSQDRGMLRLQVGLSPVQHAAVAASEHFKAPRAGLRVGTGGGLLPYKGAFDEFVMYRCAPDEFYVKSYNPF